jgi:hypothetical protein
MFIPAIFRSDLLGGIWKDASIVSQNALLAMLNSDQNIKPKLWRGTFNGHSLKVSF